MENISTGNKALYAITSGTPYKLLIELEAFDSTRAFARYDSFSIGGPETKYKLNISGYSGTAGELFIYLFIFYLFISEPNSEPIKQKIQNSRYISREYNFRPGDNQLQSYYINCDE